MGISDSLPGTEWSLRQLMLLAEAGTLPSHGTDLPGLAHPVAQRGSWVIWVAPDDQGAPVDGRLHFDPDCPATYALTLRPTTLPAWAATARDTTGWRQASHGAPACEHCHQVLAQMVKATPELGTKPSWMVFDWCETTMRVLAELGAPVTGPLPASVDLDTWDPDAGYRFRRSGNLHFEQHPSGPVSSVLTQRVRGRCAVLPSLGAPAALTCGPVHRRAVEKLLQRLDHAAEAAEQDGLIEKLTWHAHAEAARALDVRLRGTATSPEVLAAYGYTSETQQALLAFHEWSLDATRGTRPRHDEPCPVSAAQLREAVRLNRTQMAWVKTPVGYRNSWETWSTAPLMIGQDPYPLPRNEVLLRIPRALAELGDPLRCADPLTYLVSDDGYTAEEVTSALGLDNETPIEARIKALRATCI